MTDIMKTKEATIEDEYSHKLSFKEFQETEQYKQLVLESKENFPTVDDITIVMYISLWYCKDILGEEVEEVEAPPKITEFDTKLVSVFDPDEHLAKFGDVFKTKEPPIHLLEKGESKNIDNTEIRIEESS